MPASLAERSMATRKLAPAKEIVGWAMVDFDNQA